MLTDRDYAAHGQSSMHVSIAQSCVASDMLFLSDQMIGLVSIVMASCSTEASNGSGTDRWQSVLDSRQRLIDSMDCRELWAATPRGDERPMKQNEMQAEIWAHE